MILDAPVNCGQRAITNGECAIADDIAFLLRDDSANSCRANLGDRLQSIVATRDSRGDESGLRWLERDVAQFNPLNELVGLALVIH